jgi:hypothetical protein
MSLMFLSVAVIGILAVSLIYTWVLARRHRAAGNGLDTELAKPVKRHVYLINPVFLSYGIFFALLLLIIVFIFFGWSR